MALSPRPVSAGNPKTLPWRWPLAALMVFAAVFAVYHGYKEHQYLHWDDHYYVVSNDWVSDFTAQKLQPIFTEIRENNWHPLTWLSYVPLYRACDGAPGCQIAFNLILHAVNSLLVLIIAVAMLRYLQLGASDSPLSPGALLPALLFAVHPQHVESVVWIAERKDLLCALFFFSALYFWLHRDQDRCRWLALASALLAALSKPMAVTLPAILVLLDRLWFENPPLWRRTLRDTLPFWFMSVALVFLTLSAQEEYSLSQVDLWERFYWSVTGLGHYLAGFLLPLGLSPFYPATADSADLFVLAAYLLVLGSALVAGMVAIRGGRKKRIYLLGVLFLLVSLAPVSGIIKVGEQSMADRYTYIPLLPLYLGVGVLAARFGRRPLLLWPIALIILIVSGLLAHVYKSVWKDDLTLWHYIESRYPNSSVTVELNYANSLREADQVALSEVHYRKALALRPGDIKSAVSLASLLHRSGRYPEASTVIQRMVQENPDSVWAHNECAEFFQSTGDIGSASACLDRALELDPLYGETQELRMRLQEGK